MPEAGWKKAGSKSPDWTERRGRHNLLTLRIQLKNQYKNLNAKLDLQTQLPCPAVCPSDPSKTNEEEEL